MAERFTFFAGAGSIFSQWHDAAPFCVDGVRFPTAEHFMMLRKAQLFDAPREMQARILAASHPREAKALGRAVPGFDEVVWRIAARPVVAAGNFAKFTQNPMALRALLATAGTTLVEAAPRDAIWGIGLPADDPRALQRETWRGTNWLGEVLTGLRDGLLRAIGASAGA